MSKLFVGSFSHANDGALHVFDYDMCTGALVHCFSVETLENPSFLVLHPRGDVLYVTSELSGGRGAAQPIGGVAALAISPGIKEPTLLNRRLSLGARPCHVAVDATGRLLFVANYYGASVAVFPLAPDGRIEPSTALVSHEGCGVDAQRQQSPHPHSCVVDPTNRRLYVADLGVDAILAYEVDFARGGLTPREDLRVSVRPGSGPRHFKFHPNGRFAYLSNELRGTVLAFRVEDSTGELHEIHEIDALPEGYTGRRWCSEIAVAASGTLVFVGNRGNSSIAVFSVDVTSGRLTRVNCAATHGETPRHFALDPAGHRLVVGNQDSNALVVLEVNAQSGALTPVFEHRGVASPACLVFAS